MSTLHPIQAQYLAASAAYEVAYSAMPDSADVPDELWEAFGQAERTLHNARWELCKWGVDVAVKLPLCSNQQRVQLEQMLERARTNPVTRQQLADIVIKLDASTI